MTKRALIVVMAVLCGGLALTPVAQAHPYLYYGPIDGSGNTITPEPWASLYDVAAAFDTHVGGMMTPTTGATSGCNLWIGACGQTAIWTTVPGQAGSSWVGTNNGTTGGPGWTTGGSGSIDDRKIRMLDEVLSTSSCLDGLPLNTVNAVRAAWTANKNHVPDCEITLNNVRLRASYLICNLDVTQTISTGGSTQSISACGLATLDPTAIPSLWKTDSALLRSANEYIRDAAVNMTAAYMTIGDTRLVNYWYAFMGRFGLVATNQMLPSLLANIGKSDGSGQLVADDFSSAFGVALGEALRHVEISPADPSDKSKATCIPWGTVNDLDITVPVNIDGIGTLNIRITILANDLCTSIMNFAGKFTLGVGKFEGRPQYLATDATGNLNQGHTSDTPVRTNLASYTLAGGDPNLYLQYEGARPNFTAGTISGPGATPAYGSTYTFTAAPSYNGSTVGVSYQWYAGPDAGNMTAIPFAQGSTYAAPIDFYSFGGTTNQRVYKCVTSISCSGTPYTRETNVVTITGVTPPAINFTNATGAANYIPGQSATLSVDATPTYGGPLTYQWQKYDGSAWVDLPGKTQPSLTIAPLTPADAGDYHLVAYNTANKSDEKANPMYWAVSNPITIAVAPAINITTQPVGADLAIGGSHTMNVAANVASGTLSYQWQRNVGFGWQNIATGGDTDTLALTNVTVNDAGRYRCRVTNTEPTFGTYAINSMAVTVNVSSGVVFLVDPTSAGPEDGLTWATAFHALQPAVDAASTAGGGEVWVAGGTYGSPLVYNEARTEAWGSPASVQGSLVMKSNVALYGGFQGYASGAGAQELNRRDRNRYQYPAVIDGSTSNAGGPAYHVIVFGTSTAATVNAIVDGFTITGGSASGVAGDYHTWRGGAIYNWQSTPTISNCIFHGNTAAVSGGAVSNETNGGNGAGAQFINCLFYGNSADRLADSDNNPIRGGGAVFNNQANAGLTWCTFAQNAVGNPGYTVFGNASGAVYTWDASPVINSIVAAGNLPAGVAVSLQKATGSTQDMTVTYSNTQGAALAGTGNISADPLFTNAAGNDFTLAAGSPSVDTGDPGLAGDDLRGVPRPIDGGVVEVVDMGAYELSPDGPAPVCVTQTINVAAVTTITDALDVYDADNSVVEAGVWKIEVLPNSFSCADIPVKVNGVTIQVTDILGRTGTCSADVNVFEDVAPVAVANAITVTLDAAGAYTLTQTDVEAIGAGSTDNCTIDWAASTVTPSSFSCAEVAAGVTVTLTVKDQNGNASAPVTALVTVQDLTNPVAVGGNAIDVDLDGNGGYTLTFSDKLALGAGSTDACGINYASSSVSPASFGCADLGAAVPVTITLVDNNGNTAAPVAGSVTVHDVTPGVINGVAAQAFVKEMGDYTLAQALTGVAASDLCDGDITGSIVVTAFDGATPVSFPIADTAASYPTVYTLRYTATDGSGNSVYVDTNLTLIDNFPPVITINGDNPVNLECHGVYSDAGATATDIESDDLTQFIGTVGLPIPTGTPGSYNVTYSVEDPITHLIVQKVRVVNVLDTSVPVITLVGNTTLGWQRGVDFADPGYSATDACAGTINVNVTGVVDSNVAGSYTLTYNATDGYNAAVTKTRTVVVGDLVNFTTQPVGGDLYQTDPVSSPLVVTAAFENGVMPTTYQWFVKLGPIVQGIGTPAAIPVGNVITGVIPPNALPAGSYELYLVINDQTGANESNHVVVRFGSHMSITTGLTDVSFVDGHDYNWAVEIAGGIGTLTYQWSKDDGAKAMVPLSDGGGITGTNTNTLHFAPFDASMAGVYQVAVSDANESITVGPATITVGSGVPVGGALGLAALAAMTALGGAASLRRRNK